MLEARILKGKLRVGESPLFVCALLFVVSVKVYSNKEF